MTSSTGWSGLTLRRIAAEPDDAVAHRGEIDDGGHAGEVLQQDARRHERDLLLRPSIVTSHAGERLMSSRSTNRPSSRRSRFSSRIFSEYGSRDDAGKAGLLERRQAEVL